MTDQSTAPARVEALSYFFPAHDEAENIEALVAEALDVLPTLAQRFEIICVDDGSRDATPVLADRLAAEHPDVVRVVHHPVNQGYGAALRSGFGAARFDLICFTDGDRQFRLADLGRLLARLAAADQPDAVLGYRAKRADPALRIVYARAYQWCLRLFFRLRVRDVDCACKLFRREALAGVRLESGGAFLSAELLIKVQAGGARLAEVAVPHHPRLAGSQSGARPQVILRAVRDFWRLRIRLWLDRPAALQKGAPLLGSGSTPD
ncbi:MAG TPA: glycosyltransferase family 2 protein [Candidatus Limnocylindrales bacterium]|nr:glycosyltransferase family 2 protein [Candidatus Limnocylindrales bacterium]